MITKGKVIDVREDGTAIIKTSINVAEFIRKEIKECYVDLDLIDSRPLSDKQRKMCYALINAIGEWSGQDTQDLKEYFKMKFWTEHIDTLADRIFSLSNAPMSLVREFQKFLINFVLENDVPTKRPLYEYVDDIDNYVYMCLIHKKCAVCGTKKNVELNHVDTIGIGNDRTEVQHEGREAISLCKEHHQEYHTIGKQTFFEKYHFNGGVKIDRTLLKIYKLKR